MGAGGWDELTATVFVGDPGAKEPRRGTRSSSKCLLSEPRRGGEGVRSDRAARRAGVDNSRSFMNSDLADVFPEDVHADARARRRMKPFATTILRGRLA